MMICLILNNEEDLDDDDDGIGAFVIFWKKRKDHLPQWIPPPEHDCDEASFDLKLLIN